MSSNRSKQILDLVKNKDRGNIICDEEQTQTNISNDQVHPNTTSDVHLTRSIQCSPLPVEADLEIIKKMEELVGDAVFSEDVNHVEEDQIVQVCHQPDRSELIQNGMSTTECSSNTPTHNNEQPSETDQHESVALHDPFLSSETLTPQMICPLSAISLHENVDTPVLTPIFDDFPHSSPPSELSENQTPMPSPLNRHGICQDSFCCQHDDKGNTQLIQNTDMFSNSQSPTTLVRNRGKKRIRNREDWGEVKRKRLTNEGKTYCSKRGRTIPEKAMREVCNCRSKCKDKISEDTRKDIFKKFWAIGDRAKQWLYIAKYTKKEHKRRTYYAKIGKHNRIYTYKYFLPEKQSHTTMIEVCKIMFLNTLGITERMTRTAWQKYDGTTSVEKDMRGFHNSHKKVVDDQMITSVCEHVKSFVPIESHYCRSSSTRLYLDGSLSIARMFILYKDWLNDKGHENPAKTLRQYRDIVNCHFKLSFHIPKKDACDQCHVFKNTDNPSDELKTEYANHQKNKKRSRELKSKDKADAALSNGLIVCATFDLQKVLSCPHGQMSILYYKRKLSCYNLTVFDVAGKEGFCYVWDESIAKRGANEVSSCLYDFIEEFAKKGTKEFRFWSDNCAGQNKNRIMFAMYAFAVKKFGVKITHRFLEKGHTQNEGDSVHSVIERAGEHKAIYTPEEWKLLIRWAKTTDKSYQVRDITQENVFDFKVLLSNKNWEKNSMGQKVAWKRIREVVVEDSKSLSYKYNLDDEEMTLVFRKDTRNRRNNNIVLKMAYSRPIPLSTDKFKDLTSLVESGVIPSRYHSFFLSLRHSQVQQNESDSEE